MKMTIESSLAALARYTPDSIALSEAALELGWSVERLPSWCFPVHLGRITRLYPPRV
jgi:hypothetical protein